MTGHDHFGRLRLQQFMAPEAVTALTDWEFAGEYWVGEASGFTEFLCLESDPTVLRSIALDLTELPTDVSRGVLVAVGLPLAAGMSRKDVAGLMGQPSVEHRFPQARDRVTCVYRLPEPAYEVSCTLHEANGLVYVVMTSLAPRPKKRRRS